MDKKEELQLRIMRGIMKVDYLADLAGKLPKGKNREEIGGKSIRVLMSLYEFEDGFMELYPGECLFLPDKRCDSPNKGTFHCWKCPPYLSALYGSGEPVSPKLF